MSEPPSHSPAPSVSERSSKPSGSSDPSQVTPGESKELPSGNLAHSPLAGAMAPLLVDACGGRLRDIHWYRTDWQRGGALTGYATFESDDAGAVDVVIKLPVPPAELTWLKRLQTAENVVPKLFGSGSELGQYDMAWVVMERLAHGPLGMKWNGAEFDLLIEAAGRFYLAAGGHPVDGQARSRDWEAIIKLARDKVRQHSVPDESQWAKTLKAAQKKLKGWVDLWHDRPIEDWCHGDLHLANAMTRVAPPEGPALLFDFALTRPGHWVEDAVYFEHLFWSQSDRLGGRKLCKMIARERKRLGLKNDPNWADYAQVRRALLALATPASLDQRGDPAHLQAALEVLQREV